MNLNLMPGNMFYKYDWTFDNCTTRLRDLMEKAADTLYSLWEMYYIQKKLSVILSMYILIKMINNGASLGLIFFLGSPTDAVIQRQTGNVFT